ncbi:protein cueball [Diachasma alloeum]|uniref:protein cueball n=1 Tax=Diachasma alloeum TaxID=454923 RepID=UPI00073815EC|nr:protein cueball [Diachasma alloeum]
MDLCHPRVTVLLFILTIFGVPRAHARTWDLAVTIGREINFLSSNGTLIGRVLNPSAVSLTAMAYDDATHEMYLGDTRNKNISIFSKTLSEDTKTWTPVLPNTNSTHIIGMVFDPVSSSLFYIDSKLSSILNLKVNPSSNKSTRDFTPPPEVILELPDQSPRGLSLDLCRRTLYWANSNASSPSIESSDLSGTSRRTIINSNLYEPLAVAVDHTSGKLYWIDDEEGIHYKIERSNLDGSMRELLVHGKHQQPVHLAIDDQSIYWTDWVHSSIWRLRKTPVPGDEPEKWKSFFDTNRDADPTSLISRDNLGRVDCVAVERLRKSKLEEDQQDVEVYEGLVTSTEDDGDGKSKEAMFCLHGAKLTEGNRSCSCQKGYDGVHCETSVCHNYCVRGECTVDYEGRPRCKCPSRFRGRRCEQDACVGFCLNGGECEIQNGEPYCRCQGATGVRCEERIGGDGVCGLLCRSGVQEFGSYDRIICRCSERNATENSQCSMYTYGVENKILVIIFSVIISVLTASIIVLSYFVNKFRRRPRIKKRFVVSKNGITPLTSRPQLPGDQCEIMIENCCNMNICETPCFEPNLRSPEPRLSKKEEKNSLLLDMDGNNSC